MKKLLVILFLLGVLTLTGCSAVENQVTENLPRNENSNEESENSEGENSDEDEDDDEDEEDDD